MNVGKEDSCPVLGLTIAEPPQYVPLNIDRVVEYDPSTEGFYYTRTAEMPHLDPFPSREHSNPWTVFFKFWSLVIILT
jgi:hypothetical protein